MLVVDPIPLYKDGEWRRIPAIDAQSWINTGWTTEIPAKTPVPPSDTKVEKDISVLMPSDTKVETTKRKSPNQ